MGAPCSSRARFRLRRPIPSSSQSEPGLSVASTQHLLPLPRQRQYNPPARVPKTPSDDGIRPGYTERRTCQGRSSTWRTQKKFGAGRLQTSRGAGRILVQTGCKPLAVQPKNWCRPTANLSRCSPKIGADRLQTSRGAAPPWIVATCAAKRIGRHVSRSRSLGSSTHDSANRLLAAVSRVIPTGCHATRQTSRVGLHRARFAAGMQQIFFPQQMASLSIYDQ